MGNYLLKIKQITVNVLSTPSASQIQPHHLLKSPKALSAEAFPGGFVEEPVVYAHSGDSKLFSSSLCVVDERLAVSLIQKMSSLVPSFCDL